MKTVTRLFIIVLLVAMNFFMGVYALDTERRADQWNRRANSFQTVRQLNMEILRAHEYSENLAESVRMLANENGILCERDKASMEVVAQYDEENRNLKASLDDSCDLVEEQQEEIDDMIDDIEDLEWKIDELESVIDTLTDNMAEDAFAEVDEVTVDVLVTPGGIAWENVAAIAIAIIPFLF